MQNRALVFLALALSILPTLAITLSYFISAREGFVPWCVPFWDSCTSISATGREGLAFFFFKSTMIPIALLYLWYWRASNKLLNDLGARGRLIARLGLLASVALLCYVLALGAVGDNFRVTRRVGVILYFTLTYFCQLQIVYQFRRLTLPLSGAHWQMGLLLVILVLGVTTLIWDAALPHYDRVEDAFEWNIALLLHINFLLAAVGWAKLSYDPAEIRRE